MAHHTTIKHPEAFIREALQSLDINFSHSNEALAETRHWLDNPGLDDPALSDLTHLPFVTIDNEDSKDLDQALYISSDGYDYHLMYALADASYYIRPGSALFAEALQRGTTFYTPLLAVPMLPPALSEGLISLNPDVERRSLVFDMRLRSDGEVLNCQIVRAKIRSHAKLSYQGVQQWLDAKQGDTQPYHPPLRLLKELGSTLINAGEARGIIQFDRQETHIKLEGEPLSLSAAPRERYATERYNEQISLICNMQGAKLLLGLAGISDVLQAVYRVHEAPLKKSLAQLKVTLDELAESANDSEHWRWQKDQTLADFVASLPDDKKHERRVSAIQRQIMMAQRGSQFTPEPGEHHALKACSYARFSSPMREVVGIFTHKELLEALEGGEYDNEADHALREQIITSANVARQTQRQLDKKIQLAVLHTVFMHELETQTPQWHQGTIMGVRSDKLYIKLDDMAIDVKVYIDNLDTLFGTRYTTTSVSAQAAKESAPAWTLGDAIQLRANGYDANKQRFEFDMRHE